MIKAKPTIFTLGHSTRPIEEFVELLRQHRIQTVVDVRTIPGSRHNPQYNEATLKGSLGSAGIKYKHIKGLGGLRKPAKDSVNMGWRNLAFRGFADYMQTPAFRSNLEELIEIAEKAPTAIMCSEAVPWRCHRSLIGDALAARGFPVVDVIGKSSSQPHRMTPFAKVEGDAVTYPDGSI